MKKSILIILSSLLLSGCAELTSIIGSGTGSVPLTEKEVVDGLKEALTVGAKNVSSRLSAENGYYGDKLIKIPLPEEADVIVKNISKIPYLNLVGSFTNGPEIMMLTRAFTD